MTGQGFGLDRVSTLRAVKGVPMMVRRVLGSMRVERGCPTPMHLTVTSLPPHRAPEKEFSAPGWWEEVKI